MPRRGELDGFQCFSGLVAVVAGPVTLATGWPTVWSVVLTACGVVILGAAWRTRAPRPAVRPVSAPPTARHTTPSMYAASDDAQANIEGRLSVAETTDA